MSKPMIIWLLTITGMVGCALEETSSSGSSEGSGSGEPLASPGEVGGVQAPFARACARLHGECAPVCDNLLVECYADAATCTEQWTADYLEDYDFPLVDEALVAECAAQVDRQACTDLRPDTAACEYAIVDSCPDDTDAYDDPYSPYWAQPVELGDVLEVHLCDGVPEYFALTLEGGTELEILEEDDRSSVYSRLLRLSTNGAGEALVEDSSLREPVPVDGEYVLAIEASVRGDRRLTIALRAEDE